MSQSPWVTLDPNVHGGTFLAGALNAWVAAVISSHLGATRPTYAVKGTFWAKDVSPTVCEIYFYDGASDLLIATANPTAHTIIFANAGAGLGANTYTGMQLVTGSSANFTAFLADSDDASANHGPYIILRRRSATPAVNDNGGVINFQFNNSTPVAFDGANIIGRLIIPTAGAESVGLDFATRTAGVYSNRVYIGAGLYMNGATGSDPGAGKINATEYLQNGVPLADVKMSAMRVYTAGATWTKPANLHSVIVELVGAGGGSGGVSAAGASTQAISQAGGAGGYSRKRILAAALGGTETVTVGAAGAAGASGNNVGTAGGTSSFGAHLTATGGAAGAGSAGLGGASAKEGALGGVGSGGDVNCSGGPSASYFRAGSGGQWVIPNGGNSFFSGGGLGATVAAGPGATQGAGQAATGHGGGGGGSASQNAGTAQAGAAGAVGLVIVYEFTSA